MGLRDDFRGEKELVITKSSRTFHRLFVFRLGTKSPQTLVPSHPVTEFKPDFSFGWGCFQDDFHLGGTLDQGPLWKNPVFSGLELDSAFLREENGGNALFGLKSNGPFWWAFLVGLLVLFFSFGLCLSTFLLLILCKNYCCTLATRFPHFVHLHSLRNLLLRLLPYE